MAKVSAHGATIGQLDFTTASRRYMSDGTILRNAGDGWKLHGKVKAGLNPADVFKAAAERQAAILAEHPEIAAYRKALHDMAGLCKRGRLHLAVSLMPDDADGVWSEVCDGYGDNISADVDEVAELCRLYQRIPRAAVAAAA